MVVKGGRKSRHRRTKHKRHHKRKHKRRTKHRRHRMKGGSRPGIAPLNGSPAAPFNEKWGGPARAFPPGPMYTPGVYNDAKYYCLGKVIWSSSDNVLKQQYGKFYTVYIDINDQVEHYVRFGDVFTTFNYNIMEPL